MCIVVLFKSHAVASMYLNAPTTVAKLHSSHLTVLSLLSNWGNYDPCQLELSIFYAIEILRTMRLQRFLIEKVSNKIRSHENRLSLVAPGQQLNPLAVQCTSHRLFII